MAIGYITIQATTKQGTMPITQAHVKIINAKTNEVVYEKENAVDESGKTESIEVEVPKKILSEQPRTTQELPYGVFDIYVTAPNYRPVIVEQVSVFATITSIQPIEMARLPRAQVGDIEPEIIRLMPQQLILDEQRDLQRGSNRAPFVLQQVYVPEYIIVHLGMPDSPARNVKVNFVDYIKNVASSEIYPTWPTEALLANIYAQISFALNRVYTEWYRNRGYTFQITNTTAYDQYFVEGRNIFENISRIVDDIFSEYVAIVGKKTPYFTQYCNGTTSTCNGLSQWGTVDLANQGKKALEIIQYYYGYDKTIRDARIIEGIPESYPGTALRQGMRNENVRVIQNQLNRIAQNYPAIPKIQPVTGVFDARTEEAVKTFQRIFNLTPDGIVGRATWYKISSIYVAVKRLAELDQEAEPDTGEPQYTGEYPGYILREGTRGEDVKEMQMYLNTLSEYYPIPSINADGIFGPLTRRAVVAFQRLFGLQVDGLVGPQTWNRLFEVYSDLRSGAVEQEVFFNTVYPGYVLKRRAKGEAIRRLQTFLSAIAEQYSAIPLQDVDGIFSYKTECAVKAFQRKFGLLPNGEVDKWTWNKIILVYESLTNRRKITESELFYPYSGKALKRGSSDGYVRLLQIYINVISQRYDVIKEVVVDSWYDDEMVQRISEIQHYLGLPVTGVTDRATWEAVAQIYHHLYWGIEPAILRKR